MSGRAAKASEVDTALAIEIRALTSADISELPGIDPGFVSDAELTLCKSMRNLDLTWSLTRQPLHQPFDKGHGYDLRREELCSIRERHNSGRCLQLIAEGHGRIVGLLEVEPEDWRRVGWVWNILVDRQQRRRGIGRAFVCRAIEWAEEHDLMALVAETQTNNIIACEFYATLGFVPGGIDHLYYRCCGNTSVREDIAIFWYLEL